MNTSLLKYLVGFLILFLPCVVQAQKEGNMWYFGLGAGIDFNTSPPTVLTDGQTWSREGVATISDKNTGKLLFYTEGTKVWDADQQVMPNGTGLNGDYSSTQSAIIVPDPGNPNKYYIFTTAKSKGFRYSEVDMTLNRGKGDVIAETKNTVLIPDNKSTEKLIATRHCNGKDYWVITHTLGDNSFYVYLVTASGIQSPLIFKVGSVIYPKGSEVTSYLKVSPDGRLLAHAFGLPLGDPISKVELLHFDNKTGTVSGPVTVLNELSYPYGVEFSPDGNLLYVSTQQGSYIWQYNLQATNINVSRVNVFTSSNLAYGAMQLATNGKIYVSAENGYNNGYGYLGVINNPGIIGKGCNYIPNGLYLGGRATLIGLPTFLGSIFYHPEDFEVKNTCYGSQTLFKISNTKNIDSVHWAFGDTDSSIAIAASHLYKKPGDYNVRLIIYYPCRSDTVNKVISICESRDKTVNAAICEGGSYLLPDGRKVSKSGDYVSHPKNECGCSMKITTHLKVNKSYHITVKDSICPEAVFKLPDGRTVNKPGTYTSEFQSENGCDSVIVTQLFIKKQIITHLYDTICIGGVFTLPDGKIVDQSGRYKVVYNATNGCDSIVFYHLKVMYPPEVHLREDFCIVPGEVIKLQPAMGEGSTLWQNGSSLSSFEVRIPGLYWVKVTNRCGIDADTIRATNDCLGRIFVPTAFTPNNDGQNDVFRILNIHGQHLIRFDIFDRWGKKVFHTTNIYEGWKGKEANLGSYIYYIKLRTVTDKTKIIKGTVTLIR